MTKQYDVNLNNGNVYKMKSGKGKSITSLVSLLSVTFVVVVLTIVVTWHGNVKEYEQQQRLLSSWSTNRNTNTNIKTNENAVDTNEIPERRWLSYEQPIETSSSSSSRTSKATTETTTTTTYLFGQDGDDDGDASRSEICKEYLYNFLNGTTDAKDQCQGFYNAYKAADCQDDTHIILLSPPTASSSSSSFLSTFGAMDKNTNDAKNDTKDDDPMIDDFFKNWECCDSIETFYEKNCENGSELHSVRLLGIMLVLLVCTTTKAFLKRMEIHWLPDACAFILVGAIVGGILRLYDRGLVQKKLSFDNDLFLQILLPPIIFQAALSIDKRAFRRDLFPILAFAGLGTAFSAIGIGIITHHVSKWGNGEHLPLLDSLVFGALISSIDPVATLSILSGVGVSQTDTLYILIFGESLLNDGVAIVLFDTLKSHLGESDSLGQEAYKAMARNFCAVLFGSIGIGIGVGMACTIYFYCLRGRQTAVTEVAIFFCWALIPYYIADGLGCSGIIAIMVMGFFMDYYVIGGFQSEDVAWMDYMAMRNQQENGVVVQQAPMDNWALLHDSLSKAFSGRGHILSRSRHHVGFVAQVVASLMDTSIFAYLGLFLFNGGDVWNMRLNLTSILSCVSSRAVMVAGLSFLINVAVFFDLENHLSKCFRIFRRGMNLATNDDDESITSQSRVYLDQKTQVILLLAGVRGAVSFALVENIPIWDGVTKEGSKYKSELKAMTSSAIVFTLFVFGALTYITVKRGSDSAGGSGHVVGNLTHRLLSEPLDSDDENQSEMTSSVLEIESHQDQRNISILDQTPMSRRTIPEQSPGPYRAPDHHHHLQQQPQQFQSPNNEWTE